MNLLETIQKRIPYRYGVLLAIILLIFALKQFMSLLLLTIIFSYLAMSVAKPLAHFFENISGCINCVSLHYFYQCRVISHPTRCCYAN